MGPIFFRGRVGAKTAQLNIVMRAFVTLLQDNRAQIVSEKACRLVLQMMLESK